MQKNTGVMAYGEHVMRKPREKQKTPKPSTASPSTKRGLFHVLSTAGLPSPQDRMLREVPHATVWFGVTCSGSRQ